MWQDEGFNTFINTFSEARRYPEKGDQMTRALGERGYVEGAMKQNVDGPIEVNPDRINPALLGLEAYVKPSVGLQLLRQEIMGPAAFDDAFRAYAERWKFRHPTPADFFRTMEDVGGRRLDWFCASRSATARSRTTTTRPRSGARTRRTTSDGIASSARSSRTSTSIRTDGSSI